MMLAQTNDRRQFRDAIENEIERLISLLDNLDPDSDLEDGDEGIADRDALDLETNGEPWLGWTERGLDWVEGEPLDEGEDEREADPAEAGIADRAALADIEPMLFGVGR